MRIKPYWDYFKYVMEHKKNVFIECWSDRLYKEAFTHDLSKFKPSEFLPYARYFYIDKEKYKEEFDKAWIKHYSGNPHHWDNHVLRFGSDTSKWTCFDMSSREIREMICDWKAMSRRFGDTAQEFYLNNYHKIKLNRDSRYFLECKLGLLDKFNAPICEHNQEFWMTLEELANDSRTRSHFERLMRNLIIEYHWIDIYSAVTGRKEK